MKKCRFCPQIFKKKEGALRRSFGRAVRERETEIRASLQEYNNQVTLDRWKDSAKEGLRQKKGSDVLKKEKPFKMDEFLGQKADFDLLDLKQLSAGSLEGMLKDYPKNEPLFRQAEEMQRQMAKALYGDHGLTDDEILTTRARIEVILEVRDMARRLMKRSMEAPTPRRSSSGPSSSRSARSRTSRPILPRKRRS